MKCYAVITAGETAFFRARADALLFIRARNDSNSRLEVQETAEQQLSAFALYDCTECIIFLWHGCLPGTYRISAGIYCTCVHTGNIPAPDSEMRIYLK